MIYMVEHIFTQPNVEPAWNEWYTGYLCKLLSVPGFDSGQRFKAPGLTPSRYMAMYSVKSPEIYESQAYRNIGGGGSQSANFHAAYKLWNRNLFDGAAMAPTVGTGQWILTVDATSRDRSLPSAQQPLWLESVGLHKTTPFRALIVLDADAAKSTPRVEGGFFYEPITPRMIPK